MYKRLAFIDAIKDNLRVMDATAISLCMEEKLPIQVFNIIKEGNIKEVLSGAKVGTLVDHIESELA